MVESGPINYREKYREMKSQFRYLVYENESLKDELLKCQHKLVKVSRDQKFLMDRLMQHESPAPNESSSSSSDDEETDSSDGESVVKNGNIPAPVIKRKRLASATEEKRVRVLMPNSGPPGGSPPSLGSPHPPPLAPGQPTLPPAAAASSAGKGKPKPAKIKSKPAASAKPPSSPSAPGKRAVAPPASSKPSKANPSSSAPKRKVIIKAKPSKLDNFKSKLGPKPASVSPKKPPARQPAKPQKKPLLMTPPAVLSSSSVTPAGSSSPTSSSGQGLTYGVSSTLASRSLSQLAQATAVRGNASAKPEDWPRSTASGEHSSPPAVVPSIHPSVITL